MLRTIRLTLAIVFFAIITLLFLDFSGTLHGYMGWMAKIQFLPALLALNVGVVLLLVVLTLLFGRVYCSVICPLGVFQDVISRFAGKRKKNRFRYSPARKWLRYGMLALFFVTLVAGVRFHAVASLLEPYSSYGRIASNLFAPVYQWGNNLLAYPGGAGRQLCLLRNGGVDEKPVHLHHSRNYFYRTVHLGMERRAHLLQHDLPSGYGARFPVQILPLQTRHRHHEVQRLRTLRPQLQGVLHQLQSPRNRLQPLRSVHGLSG